MMAHPNDGVPHLGEPGWRPPQAQPKVAAPVPGGQPATDGKLSFRRAKATGFSFRDQLRNPMNITVTPSGRGSMNAACTDGMKDLVTAAGLKQDLFLIGYGINDETGCIALYPEPVGTPESMTPGKTSNGYYTFHLGALLQENPDLRPERTVLCTVSPDVDAEGAPCLIVALRGGRIKGKRKATGPRGKSTQPDDKENADDKGDGNPQADQDAQS
jgi:hypothetical protein